MVIKIEPRLAGNILIGVCSALIIFHVVNMLGLIPLNITWLGRVNADRAKLVMGSLSILINCVIILCALVKCNYVNNAFLTTSIERVLPFVFWWLVGNTVANLFSKTTFEVVVFTPILIILSYCFYIIKNKADQ